jgi:hypothetical protein
LGKEKTGNGYDTAWFLCKRDAFGNQKEKEKNVSLVEKEKILRAHQLELQKEEEEAPIATKLKKRFNLIKGFLYTKNYDII